MNTSHLDKTSKHFWNGFGPANSENLKICEANKIKLNEADMRLGQDLWQAYKNGHLEDLALLSSNKFLAFPYLQEVIQAHLDRFPKEGTKGRPESVMEYIIKNVSTDLNEVMQEFWKRESIYGFGDTQVKEIYDRVMQRH